MHGGSSNILECKEETHVNYLILQQRCCLSTTPDAIVNSVLYFHRYPNYEFISDNSISWSAGLHNRYTENSLRGVILDIHFLSQADFLVCTFSSQVNCNINTI